MPAGVMGRGRCKVVKKLGSMLGKMILIVLSGTGSRTSSYVYICRTHCFIIGDIMAVYFPNLAKRTDSLYAALPPGFVNAW